VSFFLRSDELKNLSLVKIRFSEIYKRVKKSERLFQDDGEIFFCINLFFIFWSDARRDVHCSEVRA